MKRLLVLFGCGALLMTVAGCRRSGEDAKGSDVVVSRFPRSLAGAWQAPQYKIWISPEGKVTSAIIDMAALEIRPNQTTKMEMKDGSISTFTAGDCPVEYDSVSRELRVVIEIEKLHIKFLDIVNDGNRTDIFSGKVSEDGKAWMADWINMFNFGSDLPQDPNDAYMGQLRFDKVSEWGKR
jgi:hypothetical protein